jgi:hypothetical protein
MENTVDNLHLNMQAKRPHRKDAHQAVLQAVFVEERHPCSAADSVQKSRNTGLEKVLTILSGLVRIQHVSDVTGPAAIRE